MILATALTLAVFSTVSATERSDPTIKLVVEVEPGPHFVGQAISIGVGSICRGDRPRISPPKPAGAELYLASGTRFRQLSGSTIGDLVSTRHLYVTSYRLVPARSGNLTIPPFRAESQEGRASSSTTSIQVSPIPVDGRAPGFLGGVGPIDVVAAADPVRLRLGSSTDFRLGLAGEGALASREIPVISTTGDDPSRLVFEGTELIPDPPSRVFRYRFSPRRAGEITIPAVSVATFDPVSRRYLSKVSKSIKIRVEEVPKLDPARFVTPEATRPNLSAWVYVAIGSVATAACSIALFLRARGRASRPDRVVSISEHAARVESAANEAELHQAFGDGLIAFRSTVEIGRSGEVTPEDLIETLSRLEAEPDLIDRAGGLVGRMDRRRFGQGASGVGWESLRGEASRLLRELDRESRRKR